MRSLRSVCLLAVLLSALLLGSCKTAETDYFSYRTETFTVHLDGNRMGKDFSCVAECADGSIRSVVYSAPEALNGIRITAVENGYSIEQNGLAHIFDADADALAGLLAPVRLLLLPNSSVRSVQKIPTGTLLTVDSDLFSEPVSLTLGKDGFPSVLTADGITVQAKKAPLPQA